MKGWDLAVAVRTKELNKALDKVVYKFLLSHTLPSFEYHEDPSNGQSWGMRKSVTLRGMRLSSLYLYAIQGKEQEGRLQVTFSAGTLKVSSQPVVQNQVQSEFIHPRDMHLKF